MWTHRHRHIQPATWLPAVSLSSLFPCFFTLTFRYVFFCSLIVPPSLLLTHILLAFFFKIAFSTPVSLSCFTFFLSLSFMSLFFYILLFSLSTHTFQLYNRKKRKSIFSLRLSLWESKMKEKERRSPQSTRAKQR